MLLSMDLMNDGKILLTVHNLTMGTSQVIYKKVGFGACRNIGLAKSIPSIWYSIVGNIANLLRPLHRGPFSFQW